ncbi:MAG: response regulator, partial [Flavobacteriales bacterium]|nr:response regulator [Flavobacteriales bacterium]
MPDESLMRILYVDDDEMALTLTQCQFLREGIHTETTSDVVEAVSFLTTQPLDLILLDSVMPTID